MTDQTVKLDVREDIRSGREPFSRIMSAVAGLAEEQDLLLVAPFEPRPLFDVLAKKGFQHRSREVARGWWEVLFSRTSDPKSTNRSALDKTPSAPALPGGPGSIVDVDARGLEPPQPMVRILESLATLPEGAQLRAHTDRRPVHLYPHLEERGFIGESREQDNGSFITHIRRVH